MEILDVVDETGAPTGETVERAEAHREGVRHRTAHVWIARNRNGRIQLLLQKRCMQKDSFPGCYDISSAGHIPKKLRVCAGWIMPRCGAWWLRIHFQTVSSWRNLI